MANKLLLTLYRMFVVFPPAMSLRILRNKLSIRTLYSKLISGTPRENEIAPMAHPIDRHYGIDTSGYLGFGHVESWKHSARFSTAYAGSQPSIIRKAIDMLPDQNNLTFLDLGCGKGRALAVASEFPFRRIVGVELFPSLAATARNNAEIMRRQFPGRTSIEVIEGDALGTAIPDGPIVIYLYHPFFRKIMKGVVRNVEKWLSKGKSKAYVVYYNPVYFDLYDESRLFRRVYAGMMDVEPSELGTGNIDQAAAADAVAIWQSLGEPILQPHPQAAARIQIEATGLLAKVVW